MNRLAGYWKAFLVIGGGLATVLATIPLDSLNPTVAAAIGTVTSVLAVLCGPSNKTKPEEPQPPESWPGTHPMER